MMIGCISRCLQKSDGRNFILRNPVRVGRHLSSSGASVSADSSPVPDADSYRTQHQIRISSAAGLSEEYPPIMNFESAPFSKILKEVLLSEGFTAPSPTQAQSWPIALEKRDIISVARTGSGKTCGFLLPAFEQLLATKIVATEGEIIHPRRQQSPTVLVLAPTRELAIQIDSEAQKFSEACELVATCLYGGIPKKTQIQKLKAGVDVVIATPGRCIDLSDAGSLDLSRISYLVLDEADRMLDMGFEPQIRSILSRIPPQRQSLYFSATWPFEVQALAEEFLNDPVQINIGDRDVLNANMAIEQHILVIKEHEKTDKLIGLLEIINEPNGKEHALLPKTIIFIARRSECDSVVRLLNRIGYPTDSLHGDRTQDMRDKAMERFRDGTIRILVATDVASRGLDVKDIEIVLNYDFPLGASGVESYVHRIGRTARGDRTGIAFTFFTERDARMAPDLSALLVRCRQTTPPALKAMIRDVTSAYPSQGDSRRGKIISTKITPPFKPLKKPLVKKNHGKGHHMKCKGESIGRRNIGQYESSSSTSKGGGARSVATEISNLKLKKEQSKTTQDYGDY